MTVLDSARPCFFTTLNQPQPGDAQFVDAIHTNTALFGSSATLGDADFYPNWGLWQPACNLTSNLFCSHENSMNLYAESVNSKQCVAAKYTQDLLIPGVQQNSTAIMGFHWGREPGKYYLKTNSKSEFCKGSSGY